MLEYQLTTSVLSMYNFFLKSGIATKEWQQSIQLIQDCMKNRNIQASIQHAMANQ